MHILVKDLERPSTTKSFDFCDVKSFYDKSCHVGKMFVGKLQMFLQGILILLFFLILCAQIV